MTAEAKVPLYQVLASRINAMQNCQKASNGEWLDKHEEAIKKLVEDNFPHGSGIDGGYGEFDYGRCTDKKLVFHSEYHYMNENGYYDGWYDFKVIVEASLMFGFNVDVKIGRRMKNYGVDEYLCEIYGEALRQMVERW